MKREWFVTYEVTSRSIVITKFGENPHEITAEEASALRDDLLAATVAEHEHRMLRDDGLLRSDEAPGNGKQQEGAR
ncbi:MAG TPA: hypothetical protein VM345_01770 [Acidimicrobiales bacterium]|nr:hypothetical protein [Acidimicrobiales bacterium]